MALPHPLSTPPPPEAPPPPRPRRLRLRTPGRRTRITLLVIGILLALIVIASFFVDEPLRRAMESEMNARMKGYTARIERLSFHPLGFGVTLYGLTFAQDAHPDPPVFAVSQLDASVEWKALIHRRLVANFRLERPLLYVDLQHLREEVKDPTPLEEHGWQDAFEAIYPLKIDEVVIVDGEATYVDPGPFKPLRVTGIQARAENIRNIHSRERDYPSALQVKAVVFESGRLALDGHADFLVKPHAGVKANVALQNVPLDYFRPVTNRYNLSVRGGTLAADGLVEYAPAFKMVELRDAEVRGVKIDYIHTPRMTGVPEKAAKVTAEAAKRSADRPDLVVRAARVRVTQSEVGVLNRAVTPEFRVFMTGVDLRVDNVTNQRSEGIGQVRLTGRFMGSGRTDVTMNLRPDPKGPNFDVALKIEDMDMTAMNPLLRRYGKFDVVQGRFSFYSELSARHGGITGYVKPLFKDVKAYDPEQDRDKGFLRRLYERLIGVVSKVLKNVPRKEVATRIDIAGRLDDPQTSTWQAIRNLLRNAFVQAILPGLEREAERPPPPEKPRP